ncbi:hypothetical protein PXH59_00495 (plasmid) [Xenorhabdus sp. SF857]|uniref:hypothetical protein n=1 Tax=Xenorhabdus bakwenae TaxID=3026967 RepID=UPI0025581113|nr:hypothetical protein [Xenorhabdus sp. SF857]WFQ78157.1 hypothetical protein PXH59_00495 [Xenorhabdus sp. SF857]
MSSDITKHDNESVFEDTISDILLNLPWKSYSAIALKKEIFAIIDSYQEIQGEVRAVCVYWLLYDEYIDETKKKLKEDSEISNKMELMARFIINVSIEKIDTKIFLTTKH